MANRLANLLSNTKTRTLVLLVVGILIFGVVIAVSQTGGSGTTSEQRTSRTAEVPSDVRSTPGEQVSRKYRELQEEANIRGAQEAEKKGTTFIPTLTGAAKGFDDSEFEKQLSAAYDDLGGKCSKETVAKLKQQGMDTTKVIIELKSYGCSAAALAALFTPEEIAAALLQADCEIGASGCTAADAKKLQERGHDPISIAAQFKRSGCTLTQTAAALKANNVPAGDIVTALRSVTQRDGQPPSAAEIAAAMTEAKMSMAEIATGMKSANMSAEDIAMALKSTGADATQIATALTKAGFSKLDILPALTKAGFSPVDIAKAMSAIDQGNEPPRQAQQRVVAQQEAESLSNYNQQRQQKIQELVSAMEAQKAQAFATWNEVPQQVLVQGEWAQKAANGTDGTAGSGRNGTRGRNGAANADDKKVILKAGSILFATLDTAVNSDEKGPITATIVSGELKGSKLMGTMSVQTESETIALNFSAINMPNEKKSMGISAVAIDPDTARTALASDVDHHYLLRWGSLFASSFVQGYASAVASSGQTQTVNQGAAGTTTTTTTPALDGRQQLFQGIAAVATKWSDVVAKNFDRPATITIDQGTGIGVLITADLEYGSDPVFYNPAVPATVQAATPQQGLAPALPGSATTAAGSGLTTDQTAALISTLVRQQQAPQNLNNPTNK
jgi:intracellular multiplication protein IcmE